MDSEGQPSGRARRWWWSGIAVVVVLLGTAFLLATAGGKRPSAGDLPETPAPAKAPAGYRVLGLGEDATLRSGVPTSEDGERGQVIATFAITKIAVDPPCAAGRGRGAGHHTLLLDVAVRTFGYPDGGMSLRIQSTLDPGAFQTQAAGGVPRGVTAGACLAATTPLPDFYGAESRFRGQLELEAGDGSGALLLTSGFSPDGGWKWTYPPA